MLLIFELSISFILIHHILIDIIWTEKRNCDLHLLSVYIQWRSSNGTTIVKSTGNVMKRKENIRNCIFRHFYFQFSHSSKWTGPYIHLYTVKVIQGGPLY